MNFRFKKASEILSTLVDNTLVNTNKVNDFTQGSILRTLYEAIAVDLESFYYLTVENIQGGIETSILEAFDFEAQEAKKAYGLVTVTFNGILTDDLVIPYGAHFSSSNSDYPQEYVTLSDYTIPSGVSSAQVTVYCTTAGAYGNIPAGVIDSFTNISSAAYVSNDEAFQSGQDDEDTEEVLVRFRKYIRALSGGTNQSLEYGATTVGNITNAYAFEQVGYVTLYAHDANGDLTDDDKDLLLQYIDEWRPAGIPVAIEPVNKSIANLAVRLNISDTSLVSDTFITKVASVVSNYLNSFVVGQDIYLSGITKTIMDMSPMGITNVDLDLTVTPDSNLRDTTQVTNSNSIKLGDIRIPYSSLKYKDTSTASSYDETVESTFTSDTTETTTTTTNDTSKSNQDTVYYGSDIIKLVDATVNSASDLGTDTNITGVYVNRQYATKVNEIIKAGTITVGFN